MPRVRTFTAALFLGASFLIAGCTDLPTGPTTEVEVVDPSYSLGSTLRGLLGRSRPGEVTVLERRIPLRRDEVESQMIGPNGGTIHLQKAGLTVNFPAGALDRRTRITITAPAGNLIGYQFEPHGIQFDRPVTVAQNMLMAKGLNLTGLDAYYFNGELKPKISPLEKLPMWLFRLLGIFRIEHFSGYVIATL